jgi:FtsP/CotA-like multicopper oxidase with cupredoxin domain
MDNALPSPTPSDFHFSGTIRRYYIAADEITWDYAPTGWDNWLGVPFNVSPRAQMAGYVEAGTKWQKALYRGYTDATFSTLLPQPPWQGVQGPTLRSEVGDMIEILFVNQLSSNYASVHSMGLAYTKENEGSVYPNNTAPGQESPFAPGDAVPPGGCVVYKWMVNQGSAPPAGQPSNMHGYHGYVTLEQDTNAGLIGPHIVYQPGMMNATIAAYREFPLLYMAFDESVSFMSAINARTHKNASNHGGFGNGPFGDAGWSGFTDSLDGHSYGNYSIWHPQLVNLMSSGRIQAPKFYSLNGYVFANNPFFQMCKDDKVIWYLYAHGSETHVFHMHGNGFQHPLGRNKASKAVSPGEMFSLFMNATGVGLWQVICHVTDHHSMGMVGDYWVHNETCPLPALS